MSENLNERLAKDDKRVKIAIVLNILIAFIVIIIIGEIIFGALFKGVYVVGHSMDTTLTGATVDNKHGGDYVYASVNDKPDYGDIVVVRKTDRFTIIKRVVAFGGDRIKLVDGKLYLMRSGEEEFTLVQEDYVDPENNIAPDKNNYPCDKDGVIEEGHLVAEGHMFLLGDNRDVSLDSRADGDYAMESLFGVVTDWSMTHKSAITKIHIFFKYSLPAFFGQDVGVEGLD